MKSVLVTGASSGIGLALSKALIARGVQVIGVARREVDLGDLFTAIPLDLSDAVAIQQALKSGLIPASVDAFVHCAGMGCFGALEQLKPSDFSKVMQVNCLSAMQITKALVPSMKAKQSGKLIYIGSEAALAGAKQGTLYCASKFALRGFTQSLAEEVKSSSIAVTLINPGMMNTPFYANTHFAPSAEVGCTIALDTVIQPIVQLLFQQTPGFVQEINLQPYRKVLIKK
jgi:short-subunit dehydrogenase